MGWIGGEDGEVQLIETVEILVFRFADGDANLYVVLQFLSLISINT